MKKFIKNYWAFSIPLVVLIIAISFLLGQKNKNQTDRTIGMVEANFTDVASEIPGRLDSLLVKQGDTVKQGDLLAIIKGNEINAIQKQALASITAAQSQLELLNHGARPEAIKSAENLENIAAHQYTLVQKTYNRMLNLYKDGVISGQEKDMAAFKLQAAKKELSTARLHLQSLKNGSRPEAIKSAEAVLKQAKEAYNLTNSIANNTRIYAPVSGIISSSIAEQGEVVNIGYPMMTIQKKHSLFIQFNIRQDKINNYNIGTIVHLNVPGCTPQEFNGKVKHISPALTFANWVPEEASGNFEMRTFTIKVTPVEHVKGLRPGMTVALNESH